MIYIIASATFLVCVHYILGREYVIGVIIGMFWMLMCLVLADKLK